MSKAVKIRTNFLCRSCGSMQPKWMGKCPDCGAWDALEEVREQPRDDRQDRFAGIRAANGTADLTRGAQPIRLSDVDTSASPRLPSGIGEFDRVLGGGLVAGMAVLVGGEPGIGKSTLLLQAAARWAGATASRAAEAVRGASG